jgi:hypothetical protein
VKISPSNIVSTLRVRYNGYQKEADFKDRERRHS